MIIVGVISLLGFIIICCVISYRVGFNRGREDGSYDMELRIMSAIRQAIKESKVQVR